MVLASEYIVTDFEHFASPIDKVVEINNEVCLVDVKTTAALDYEYLSWQLSVYKYLFGLVNPDVKIGGLGAIWIRDGATYHDVQEKPCGCDKIPAGSREKRGAVRGKILNCKGRQRGIGVPVSNDGNHSADKRFAEAEKGI